MSAGSVGGGLEASRVFAVYEFIARHFLASCSRDSVLSETGRLGGRLRGELLVGIGTERFAAKGTIVRERNYLDVFKYERLSENTLPSFEVGEEVEVASLCVEESSTVVGEAERFHGQAPELLSEPELIALMDKEGIGTDATISEHIATIQNREYAKKTPANRFTPTNIGLALVETYMYLQYPLYKPYLRAHMERECSAIGEGRVHFQEVIDSCIGEMSLVYQDVSAKKDLFRDTFVQFLNKRIPELALPVAAPAALLVERLLPCVQCGGDLNLMAQKKGDSVLRFLQCPACGNSLSLPPKGELVPQAARCPICAYSLLLVRSEKAAGEGFYLCPFCYSNPSARNQIDIESLPLGSTLPCFRCNHDCPFASTSVSSFPPQSPRKPRSVPATPVGRVGCCFVARGLAGVSACAARILRVAAPFTATLRSSRTSRKAPISASDARVSPRFGCHADLLGVSVPLLRVALRPGASVPRESADFCVCGHDAMAKHCGLSFSQPIDLAARPFSPAEIDACRAEPVAESVGTGVSATGETSVVGSGETGNREP